MSDSHPFSDLVSNQPKETSEKLTRAPESSDSKSELASVDKLSALPGSSVIPPSPYRSIHSLERNVIPTSPSTSLRGLLATRPSSASPEAVDLRPLPAEGSISRNSPHQRVSFEGNRVSAPTPNYSPRTNAYIHPLLREAAPQTPRGIDSTMTRMNRSSDSSPLRLPGPATSTKPGHESPPVASPPHSRATSPLRRFGWSPFHRTHEDAFVPVDPFRLRRLRRLSVHSPDMENHIQLESTCEENLFCCTTPLTCRPKGRFHSFLRDARYFIMDTLPRQLYSCMLLLLPSLYFSRIARLYEDAQLSKPDLESMIASYSSSRQQQQRQQIVRSSPIPPGAHYHPAPYLPFPDEWTATNVSPALVRFKHSWEAFIDSLLREWKTLNLVSALLLSAIVSMFQSQTMANDPIIRTAALLSLTSALMSLSYGCMFIVRFGTMRSMYKATRWAEEAARTTTFILWNVWVLLAMPAVWLAWSMIFFIVAILAFVWRYGSSTDPASPALLTPTAATGTRVAISTLFFLGLTYLILIIKTLHNYGRVTDEMLSMRITGGTGSLDARGERGSQRGRPMGYGRDGDRASGSVRASRGRERTGQEATESDMLPAVTGLGLTGLDEVARPPSSDEVPVEKQRPQTETV